VNVVLLCINILIEKYYTYKIDMLQNIMQTENA